MTSSWRRTAAGTGRTTGSWWTRVGPVRLPEKIAAVVTAMEARPSPQMQLRIPSSMWQPYHQEFRVANAGSLSIKLKSKPLTIELFPGKILI